MTAKFPQYLSDKHPYKKEFYVPFDKALEAAKTVLTNMGWKIVGEGNPAVYEQTTTPRAKELILFTDIRQTALFLGSRYSKMNIILRSNDTMTEVEIRYLTIMSLPFRNIESFRNDHAVEQIFARLADRLKS